jgi:hypothetical protein
MSIYIIVLSLCVTRIYIYIYIYIYMMYAVFSFFMHVVADADDFFLLSFSLSHVSWCSALGSLLCRVLVWQLQFLLLFLNSFSWFDASAKWPPYLSVLELGVGSKSKTCWYKTNKGLSLQIRHSYSHEQKSHRSCYTHSHWDWWIRPTSDILNYYKTQSFGNLGLFPSSGERGRHSVGSR